MKTQLLTSFLLISYSSFTYAYNAVNDYLLAAEQEIVASAGLPVTEMTLAGSWIEEAQIRLNTSATENLNFQDNQQSYEIRLKPKAWGQRDAEKSILQLHLNQKNNNYNQLLNESLKKRYIKLIAFIEQKYKTRQLLQLSKLLSQEIDLMRGQLLSENFKAEKFLDAESMFQQSNGMATLNVRRLNALQTELMLPIESVDNLLGSHIDWVINLSEIAKIISSNINSVDQSAPEMVNSRLQLEMYQAENERIKAEQQLGINFVKFAYNDRKKDDMEFQIGINIPLGTKFNNIESQHDIYSAQSHLAQRIKNIKQTKTEIQNDVTWLIQEREIVSSQIKRVKKHMQKDYVKTNPNLILSLRKELIAHKKKDSEIKQKALTYYIDYLALSGQLVQQPLRNWIQQGTPELITNKSH